MDPAAEVDDRVRAFGNQLVQVGSVATGSVRAELDGLAALLESHFPTRSGGWSAPLTR